MISYYLIFCLCILNKNGKPICYKEAKPWIETLIDTYMSGSHWNTHSRKFSLLISILLLEKCVHLPTRQD